MLILETVINRYLELDPETRDKLAELGGKVIKIEIEGTGQSLFMFPGEHGIQVLADYGQEPDTILRGSPSALFRMGLKPDVADMLLKGEVEIEGDTGLGRRFKNIFNSMDIDWSEPLARFLGDAAANQLVTASKQLFHWGNQGLDSVTRSIGEYLQEESRDVVSEAELGVFNHKVEQLRDGVDRLQAKLDRFRSEHQSADSAGKN